MGDSLITIIAIFLAAILMFVFPLMAISERTDDVSQLVVETTTTDFVDNVRSTGKLTLDNYDKLKPIKQNDSSTSFCKKIKKEDGEVDFNSAKKLFSKYKAYSFWPGIFLKSELKLKDIEFVENSSQNIAGEILEIAKDYIVVGCNQGRLKIRTLQAPSKNSINSVEYIKGKRLTIGDILN